MNIRRFSVFRESLGVLLVFCRNFGFSLGLSPLPGLIITRNSGDFAFWLLIISGHDKAFFLKFRSFLSILENDSYVFLLGVPLIVTIFKDGSEATFNSLKALS